jgi:hypothetical protein
MICMFVFIKANLNFSLLRMRIKPSFFFKFINHLLTKIIITDHKYLRTNVSKHLTINLTRAS